MRLGPPHDLDNAREHCFGVAQFFRLPLWRVQAGPSTSSAAAATGSSCLGHGSPSRWLFRRTIHLLLCAPVRWPLFSPTSQRKADLRSSLSRDKTEIFSGSEIAQATSADGSPYQKLANAFVYRERIVPGCTCNGHDELGIASMKIEDDPTLEPGDLIATKNRLVPFRTWRKEAKYTPIEKDATQGRKESAPTVTKKNVSIIVRSPQGPSPTNAAAPVEIPTQQW